MLLNVALLKIKIAFTVQLFLPLLILAKWLDLSGSLLNDWSLGGKSFGWTIWWWMFWTELLELGWILDWFWEWPRLFDVFEKEGADPGITEDMGRGDLVIGMFKPIKEEINQVATPRAVKWDQTDSNTPTLLTSQISAKKGSGNTDQNQTLG